MESDKPLRLHLGCGDKIWPGWVNIDSHNDAADLKADITDLPYEDGTVDEIEAIHVFEHLPFPMAGYVLEEWLRVLKPGGRLTLELPCRDKVFAFIANGVVTPQLTLWALYGEPRTMRSEADIHKWCWSKAELAAVMQKAGFTGIESQQPKYHVPIRDMRMTGVKGGD